MTEEIEKSSLMKEIMLSIEEAIIVTNSAGSIIYANPAIKGLTGWTPEDMTGNLLDEMIHFQDAETHEPLENLYQEIIIEQGQIKDHYILMTKDGSKKYASISCTPINEDEGEKTIIVFKDITRLKKTESNDRKDLLLIYDESPIGIILVDENLIIKRINSAALSIFNKSSKEFLKKPFDSVFCCQGCNKNKEVCDSGESFQFCELYTGISAALKEGLLTTNTEWPIKLKLDKQEADKWFNTSIYPTTISGKKYAVVMLDDITGTKMKEIIAEKSKNYCMDILESFPYILWKTDAQGNDIIKKKWAQFIGIDPDQSMDDWINYVHPDDRERFAKVNQSASEKREPYEIEYRLHFHDGGYRWVRSYGRPFFTIDGEYDGYIGLLIDIHYKKLADETMNMYKILSESERDIILFEDSQGNIIQANKSAVKAYGYTQEELLKMDIKGIWRNWARNNEWIEEGNKYGAFFETVHFRKDGSSFPVEISRQATVIGNRNIRVNIIRDISARKMEQRLIRQNEKKYRGLFLNMNDAFMYLKAIYDDKKKGLQFECLEVNTAFEKMFHLSSESVIGKKITEIFEENGESLLKLIAEKYKENQHLLNSEIEEIYAKDIGKWLSISIFSPSPGYVAAIIQDITERKLTDIKIKESEKKYRSLFMKMSSGLAQFKLLLDHQGNLLDLKFVDINKIFENMFGFSRQKVMGKLYSDVFGREYLESNIKTLYDNLLKSEHNLYQDEVFSPINNKWISRLIYSPAKENIVLIINDIDEKKKAEFELIKEKDNAEAANQAKSEFLANMSHEIRTPLNGIMGMIELTLLKEMNEDHRENLNIAHRCAASLLKIINDILDFSKMEAGKTIIESYNFDIKELVESLIKAHAVNAGKKGLELNYSFSSGVPQYLEGDSNRLGQVINNLLNNAIKFTDEGEVNLSVKKVNTDNDSVELKFAVSDNGIGIAHDRLKRLFKSFSQVDSSITRKYGGTGLGLVICKQIVEIMGGSIWVESEEGRGSTFYFTVRLKNGSKQELKDRYELPEYDNGPLNILLAEDDKVNQLVLERMLIEKGHTIDIASNGLEALLMHQQKQYDVILMDIQMPEMDGLEATKIIREKEGKNRHTPIIAQTAYALQGDRERFMSKGMDGYIKKPVEMEELFYTINEVLKQKQEAQFEFNGLIKLDENGELVYIDKIEERSREEIMPTVNEIETHIDQLKKVLNSNDLFKIENISHKIKEASNEIDAEELKSAAFKIELAARRCDIEHTKEYVINIINEFETYKKSIQ